MKEDQKINRSTEKALLLIKENGAVICFISALAFHDITTQVPNEVSIALEKGAETPRMDLPPLSVPDSPKPLYGNRKPTKR